MTDAELAAAIRKVAADHDREIERMTDDLAGILGGFRKLVLEARGRGMRVSTEIIDCDSLEMPLRPLLRVTGAVKISRHVEL